MVVEREGLTGVDVTKRWMDLSVVHRTFLVDVLSMIEIMAVTQRLKSRDAKDGRQARKDGR